MSTGSVLSFSEFRKSFYDRFPDLHVFDCGDVNLVKVILDGLKVNYAAKGKIAHDMHLPASAWAAKQFIRRLRFGYKPVSAEVIASLKNLSSRPYLMVEHSGRYLPDETGNPQSVFYYHPLHILGRSATAVISEVQPPKGADTDIIIPEFAEHILHLKPDEELLHLRNLLHDFFVKIAPMFNKTEQMNIGFALEKFFKDFTIWKFLLQYLPQQNMLMLCHYHHEGMIYAMRKAGRTVIELQHGLISPNDIFYCFPENIQPVRDQALFPDKILVYGEYWKQQLQKGYEFPASSVDIAGYYLFEGSVKSDSDTELLRSKIIGKKVILITTQTMLHDLFIRYIRFLSNDLTKKKEQAVIIVKNHPAEKRENYGALNDLENVVFSNQPLSQLFPMAHYHISIYSTTLYDAHRYHVKSFALDTDPALKEYVEPIIQDQVAIRLKPDQNPMDIADTTNAAHPDHYFFEPVNSNALKRLFR
ncbi:MAG: hypothetical protein Fur0041_22820 [Bacteroidia bacterium]